MGAGLLNELPRFSCQEEVDHYLNNDLIKCLVCNEFLHSLASHLIMKHGISPKSYKEAIGLPTSAPIDGLITRKRKSKSAIDNNVYENIRFHSENGGPRMGAHGKSGYYRTMVCRRTAQIRKSRTRKWLLEAIKIVSSGDSMAMVADRMGVNKRTFSHAMKRNKDILYAFHEFSGN